jgi:hypothetical protein
MSENSMNEVSYIDLHAYARNSDLKLENSQETQSSTIGWACTKIIPELFGGRVGRVVGVLPVGVQKVDGAERRSE